MNEILSVAGITSILVVIITLLFQYFPVLRVKWGGLASNVKKLIVLALYFAVGAFVAFGGCVDVFAGWTDIPRGGKAGFQSRDRLTPTSHRTLAPQRPTINGRS